MCLFLADQIFYRSFVYRQHFRLGSASLYLLLFIAFLGGIEGVDDVISQIKMACEGISCFYITGHGIDESLMKNVMKCGRDFFNLPMDKKVCISLKKSTAYRGYVQQGDELIPALSLAA